ncbi:MAG: hypothetical protein JOY71_17260 [Acetobacteraceae bacterium]|nr:hypothetical protein [Acetobacteraceae bacterium]
MNPLFLSCDLNAEDRLTLWFGFMSPRSVGIRAQQGGKIAFLVLGPESVRALHAHLSAFLEAKENSFNRAKRTWSPAVEIAT